METANEIAALLRRRLEELRTAAPDSIGAFMDFELLSCDSEAGEYVFRCKTMPWMRNILGTLHGGLCATALDQAMGFVAHCIKPGEGTAPTIQMQVSYHRPLISGEDVIVKVWVVSATRSLMSFRSEAFQASRPEKLCLSGSATYFYKPAE
ncbi:MAG: PaaI family thioesterase [Candidatus Faecousia sp.]|nr:PaaI family thioesterase [Clostridiales bacterium]MDY6180488.1 PaaI family thioesterase [Candidatus Faecousia sp.]